MKKLYARINRSDYLWIIFGTALMAASANLLFSPASMVPGGFTGLAMLIQKITEPFIPGGLPLWAGNVILNVPLILLSIKIRGWYFIKRTFMASLLFSAWLYIIPEFSIPEIGSFLARLQPAARTPWPLSSSMPCPTCRLPRFCRFWMV